MENIKEQLNFMDLTPEEKEKRGILGRLYGPCADIIHPTRNNRLYSEELWEKVVNDPIFKERIENGGIPGELDHPTDREEICTEKIAIVMPEAPKKDGKGRLIAYFDILDTPCGRIAYQLAKYGFKLGISSRGTGETIDMGNTEVVSADDYDFKCFDLVLLPSVKCARLEMQESLDTKTFKKALKESLSKSNVDERKVMEDTLQNLNINIDDETTTEKAKEKNKPKDCISETSCANKSESEESKDEQNDSKVAINDGTHKVIANLQKALTEKSELEAKYLSLQNDLAVSNIKVKDLTEELSRYKEAVIRMSSKAKQLKQKTNDYEALEEKLKANKSVIDHQRSRIIELRKQQVVMNNKLDEAMKTKEDNKTKLDESFNIKETKYQDDIKNLNESLNAMTSKVDSLNNTINDMKADSELKNREYNINIKKEKRITEQYKQIANSTMSKYISLKADMLGIKAKDIIARLPDSYTLNDVDTICENLQEYQLNLSKLPFDIHDSLQMTASNSKNDNLKNVTTNPDDEVDDFLLSLASSLTKK